jgi:hypothetical protein
VYHAARQAAVRLDVRSARSVIAASIRNYHRQQQHIQISGTITRRTFRGDYYVIEMRPEGVPDVTLTSNVGG